MLKSIRNSLIITSVLYIILGVVLVIFPQAMLSLACIAIGAVTLIYGGIRIFSYLKSKEEQGKFNLILGIVLAALGVFLLVCPQVVASFIPMALGIYLFIDSFSGLKKAMELHKLGFQNWWITLLISLAVLVLGAVLILDPLMVWKLPTVLIGVSFVVNGVGGLLNTIFTERAGKA